MFTPRANPHLLRWCALLLLAGSAAAAPPLIRKVSVPSGDVPRNGNTYELAASMGTRVGGNLFHTFVKFDLSAGEIASFGGDAGVANILARVTGGRSYIDGTIRSTTPNAKLFLMNSQGVTFGKNAMLDVAGSFAVTTADALKLADGGRFDAMDPAKDSLTAAPISAFGFLGKQSNSIVVDPGTTLTAATGQSLTFVAGSLTLAGGATEASAVKLQAPQGRLELAAVTKGDLQLTLAGASTYGNMLMTNTKLSAEDGIAIGAGQLGMSQVTGLTRGDFNVRATGTATIADGTRLMTQTDGAKPSGNFSIRGGTVRVHGASEVGSETLAGATAATRAGRVTVASRQLSVREGSKIQSTTRNAGSAGHVDVRAQQIAISGDGAFEGTGIFSNTFSTATGHSGSVQVQADALSIVNGGGITGDTFGLGNAGNVNVQARAIVIAGRNAQIKTGIFSDSFAVGPAGKGGDVRVKADTLSIRDGGLISTKTLGDGRGGDTFVTARELTIVRGNSRFFTGIAADSATNDSTSLPAHAAAAGGDVHVRADTVRLLNGGQITASTATKGRGGNVFVDAKDLTIEGHVGTAFSNISADSRAEAGAGGASGNVVVNADRLRIADGGRISATTYGAGQAGEVRVTAEVAEIESKAGDPFTGLLAVSASSRLAGAGGNVRADFGTLEMNGGGIAGNTLGPGRGGGVVVNVDNARLLGGARISADTSGLGAGGSVLVNAGNLLISGAGSLELTGIFSGSSAIGAGGLAGSVTVEAETTQLLDGGSIAATSTSSGAGGSVTVSSTRLSLDRASTIEASASGLGDAGSVDIQVIEPLEIRGASSIRTTSALSAAGTVSVTSLTDIVLEEGSSITVKALLGNAGRIALFTKHMLLLRNSQLIAEAGMNGGDIFVDPQFIILDHALISANATLTGGNIQLIAANFLPSETLVTATGSTAGTVQISAPQLNLSGALAVLNAQLVDASIRFQERCAMRLGVDASTFLVLGRGGVEEFPGEPAIVLSRPLPVPAAPGARKR